MPCCCARRPHGVPAAADQRHHAGDRAIAPGGGCCATNLRKGQGAGPWPAERGAGPTTALPRAAPAQRRAAFFCPCLGPPPSPSRSRPPPDRRLHRLRAARAPAAAALRGDPGCSAAWRWRSSPDCRSPARPRVGVGLLPAAPAASERLPHLIAGLPPQSRPHPAAGGGRRAFTRRLHRRRGELWCRVALGRGGGARHRRRRPTPSRPAAVLQRVRLPRGVVTILEGESLINDASALVL